MKDQLRLLRDCINNDRPAVVFQGDDFCAPEILEAAKEIYCKHGCSEEFLFDWQLVSIRPRACFSPSYNKVKSQTKHVWLLTLL